MAKGKSFLDDRGITLPTVIITAVLALAAAAAGVVIYNVVRDRGSGIGESTAVLDELRAAFDQDPILSGGISGIPRSSVTGGGKENDEDSTPTAAEQMDGTSDALYLATKVCPNLETRHWYAFFSSSGDRDLTSSPIERAGQNVVLSPKTTASSCQYQSTDAGVYNVQVARRSRLPRHRQFGESQLEEESGLQFCRRPSMSRVLSAKNTCELKFSGSLYVSSFYQSSDVVGKGRRASWQLISFCAVKGGYLPQVVATSTKRYYYTGSRSGTSSVDYNECIIKTSSCRAFDLGLAVGASVPGTPIKGFNVASIATPNESGGNCTITESVRPATGKVFLKTDASDTGDAYQALPDPQDCPKWGRNGVLTGTHSTDKCVYNTASANAGYCRAFGLKLEADGVSCSYIKSIATTDCPNTFRVDYNTTTGAVTRACEQALGEVPAIFYNVCGGWASTQTNTAFDHDNDGTADQTDEESSVYAYYDSSDQTYHCSFKNRYTNSTRECQSFGYSLNSKAEECELVVSRLYNPRPYRPKCPEVRALPYHTSQRELSSTLLDFRSFTPSGLVLEDEIPFNPQSQLDKLPLLLGRNGTNMGLFYLNINPKLATWYKHIHQPAINSLASNYQYNELWLPTDYPTGNVILSNYYGNNGVIVTVPGSAGTEDYFLNSNFNFLSSIYTSQSFLPNFLVPSKGRLSGFDCDDYSQFFHSLSFEQRPTTGHGRPDNSEEWVVGFNSVRRTEACKSGSTDLNITTNGTRVFWEPRYYLDVKTSGTLASTHTCKNKPARVSASDLVSSHCSVIGTVYRECSLIGSDAPFSRPGDTIPDTLSSDVNHVSNSYINTCEDVGYNSQATLDLFHFKGVGTGANDSITIGNLSLPTNAINTLGFRGITSSSSQQNLMSGTWVRSDTPNTNSGWFRYGVHGISQIWDYIHSQGSGTTPYLRTSLNNNVTVPTVNNAKVNEVNFNYSSVHGDNQESHWPLYAATSEQKCEFKVPVSVSDVNSGWFLACQALSTYFPVRFSYHKPIEVKDFTVASVSYNAAASSLPGGEYGHWRSDLLTEDNGMKHPALVKYGSADYDPPTYFHIKTNKTNGYHYCEANPTKATTAGDYTGVTKVAGNGTGDRVTNAQCATLNTALGLAVADSSITFEDISEGTKSAVDSDAKASAIGFIGHKEGPRDYYPCKWRAPFQGNKIATP